MKKIILLLLTLFIGSFIFVGCEKDSARDTEENDSNNPSLSHYQSGTIKKDESSKSSLVRKSFDLNIPTALLDNRNTASSSVTVSNGSAGNVSASAKTRHDMFVGKDNNRATGTFIWTILEFDGVENNQNMWFEFDDDGTYIVYDFETEDWWWGYYYIDNQMEYIVFDAESEWEEWWKIDNITVIDENTGETDVTCTNKNGIQFKIGSFLNSEWEEEQAYTETEYNDLLLNKTWVLESAYYADNTDTTYEWADDNYYDIIALDFRENNIVYIYDATRENGLILNDSVNAPSTDMYAYSIQLGVLTIDLGDNDLINLNLDFIGDFDENGTNDFFYTSYETEECFEGYLFLEQSVFEDYYYSIEY